MDEEFLFLMQTCPTLKEFLMTGYVSETWLTASANVLRKFMGYILEIESFIIRIEGATREGSKIDALLSAYSHQVKKEDWSMDLLIGFKHNNYGRKFESPYAKFSIRLDNRGSAQYDLSLMLFYDASDSGTKLRLQRILLRHIHASVSGATMQHYDHRRVF